MNLQKKSFIKAKKNNDENSDKKLKNSTEYESKNNKDKKNKSSVCINNEDSVKIIIKNENNSINTYEMIPLFSKK